MKTNKIKNITLTGSNGELETASSRLEAVNNELKIKEKQLLELDMQVQASQRKYKSVFDNSMGALFLTRTNGQILEANPTACKMFGYTEAEFKRIGRQGIIDHTTPRFQDKMQERKETGNTSGEITGIKKNGQRFPCEFSSRVYMEMNGEERTSTMVTDISIRKKQEEEIIKHQQLLSLAENISSMGSFILNLQTNKLIWSDELYRIFGVTPGEFEPTIENKFSLIHEADRDTVAEIYKNAIEKGGNYFFEKRIIRPDGSIRNILSQGRVEKDENGIPLQLAGIFKDITREKKINEKLKRSEAYFKGAFDNSAIGMALIGPDGSWKEVNDSVCKIVGYSREELMKLTFQDITHPDDLKLDLEYLNELIDGKRQSYQMEKRYFHKNGNIIRVLLVVSMVKDKEGKVSRFISQIEDITDRKRIEEDLQSSEEKYKILFYSNPLPILIYDIETLEILDVNEPAIAHYGYNRNEFLNLTIKDIHTEGQKPELYAMDNNYIHPNGIIRFGIKEQRKKNGDIIKVEMSGHSLFFNERNCMIVVCNDVTEKQAAEEALTLSNERYRYVTKATFDAVWDWDLKKDTIYRGEGYQALFGYDKNNLAANKDAWFKIIHPDDFKRVSEGIEKFIASPETIWSAGYRYLKADGNYAFVADRGLVLRDSKGEGIRMIGAMQDITLKKSEEQQLKLFESVITNTNEGVLISEAEAFDETAIKIVYVNEAFTNMTGFSKDELIGRSPFILQGPKTDKKSLLRLRQSVKKGEHCEIETIYYKKNGEECRVSFSIVPMTGEKGRISHWISIARDITQRNRLEVEKEVFINLVQSLGKLELGEAWFKILQSICVYSGFQYAEAWMVNIDQSYLLLNKRWTNDEGIEKLITAGKAIKIKRGEGLTGNAWNNEKVTYVNDITNQAGYLFAQFAIESKLNSSVYIPVLFKGRAIAMLGFYSGLFEIDNNRFKNLFDNISQQLGPYLQNKKSEDELARFFNLSPDFLAIAGSDGYFKKINPSFSRILGYSSKELFDKPISDFTHPEDRNITDVKRNNLMKGIPLLNFENRYLTKSGETRWLSWTSTPLPEEGLIFAVAKDTTEKRKSDEERKHILESIGDGFFAVDKNWMVTYWNKMSEQLLKVNRENIVGRNLWDVFAEAIPYSFLTNYQKAIDNNEAVHFEDFYEPLNIWLEVSAYPSHDGLSVYFKDISLRKKSEDAIRTSNERYDMVAKATNDAIWDWDLITNKVIRPGKRLETLFGYNGCEAAEVDHFWSTHVHPGDWEEVTKKRNDLFDNPAENYWEGEYRFLTTSGEYAYVHDKGYIIRDKEGKAIRMIGASQDITKEKEQVNEIIRIQQNLDSLINTTTDLIWSINAGFKIIAANKAYSDAIQAISGKHVKEGDIVLFPSTGIAIKDKWKASYKRALSGETFHIEESLCNPSIRSPWHTIVSFSPIINKDGMITGVACFAKDVTDLINAGQKLGELNISLEKRAEELASSNTELERFAFVASHDLQEPLRMVSSFLQLLEKKYNGQLDDTARKYIHFSVDGADRMKRLINDLLQYSRLGTASLDVAPVDMNEVLADVLRLFKNEVHTIDAEIIVENLPVIYAGKPAMAQLMQNLIGNALKYRSKEKPVITISGKKGENEWTFTVKDNGIGIDSKYMEKIFVIFQRLHNKDEYGGTGIGLAICKKIIERYQGKIWVESEPGNGSKFIFAIPKKQS